MKKKLIIQSLIFDKKHFKTMNEVRNWVVDHRFVLIKYKKKQIHELSMTFRARQRDPSLFDKNTFKTINVRKGIKAVIGKLK